MLDLRVTALALALLLSATPATAQDCGESFDNPDRFLDCTSLGDIGISAAITKRKALATSRVSALRDTENVAPERSALWFLVNSFGDEDTGKKNTFVALYMIAVHKREIATNDGNLYIYRNPGWFHPAGAGFHPNYNGDEFKYQKKKDLEAFAQLHEQDSVEKISDFLGGGDRFQFHGTPSDSSANSWDIRDFFSRKMSEISECKDRRVCEVRIYLLRTKTNSDRISFFTNTYDLSKIYLFTTSPFDELFRRRYEIAIR